MSSLSSRLNLRLRSSDPDNKDRLRLNQSYLEYGIFSLFRINIINLVQIKASLAKNFHIQPSEIDKMPMWEYEMFIQEMNKQVKEENDRQEAEKGDIDKKYNPRKFNNPKMPKMAAMPSFKTPKI